MNTRALDKIERCKAHCLLSHPWWASLMLQLRFVESKRHLTMATDGTHLFYNPDFTAAISDTECCGVLLHEAAHCALLHCFRRHHREPLLWNIACDQAVNALLNADEIQLPAGCVPPGDLNKTAEELYQELLKNAIKISCPMDVLDAESSQKTEYGSLTEENWKQVIAQNRGLEPKNISRTIENNSQPVKNWKEELARFIFSFAKSESHTWSRYSRRFTGLPGWNKEPKTTLAICIDTSGSIPDSILNLFTSECSAILKISGITAFIISADSKITGLFEPGIELPKTLVGGGGTSFIDCLEKSESLNVEAAIYFTDGEGEYPSSCKIPVLWALTQRCKTPFGESIFLGE
jgi:predicted metal-dependent peptidase